MKKKNNLKNKICSKIFDSYRTALGWKDKSELEYQSEEKLDEGKKFVEIIIRSKKNAKHIKIILQANKSSKSDFAKLLYNEREIPIDIQRKRGDGYVYSIAYDDSYHLNCYLDKLAISIDKKNDMVSFPNPAYEKDENKTVKKSYYVLNLRGFLRFLLLTKRNSKYPYKEINKVIKTLAENDYERFQNEIRSFNNYIVIPLEKQTSFHVNNFYKHRINESFSFLSCYTRYKKRLPKRYAANILIEAAKELEGKLETMDIPELKYEVTSRFFIEIENYFWEGYSRPAIVNLETRISDRHIISDDLFTTLKNFQEENRNYLKEWKEKELQDHLKITEYYNEENYKNELKRKILKFLDNADRSIIYTKDILDPNNLGHPFELSALEIGAIKEICENDRPDYETHLGFFMVKRNKIEQIKELLNLKKNTFEEIKEEICKKEIFSEIEIKEMIKLADMELKDIETNEPQ